MSTLNVIVRKDRCFNARAGEEEGCGYLRSGRNANRNSTGNGELIELWVRVFL